MEYIKFFAEITNDDVPIIGGKNASLGEMYSALAEKNVKVPNGFATTANAYRYFISHNNLQERIQTALQNLDASNVSKLAETGARIRQWIMHGEIPGDLANEICKAYQSLEKEYGENVDVAVRSSATAEDLPSASFAGQQETYLNIRGNENLLLTCRRVFASLFTDRAISYRIHQGFDHNNIALSIGVQKMVRADLGVSGVLFTLDTESGFRDVVFITACYGLGENIVQGKVNPDEFYVYKNTLKQNYRPILKRHLGDKAIKMIYASDSQAGISTRNVRVRKEEREKFTLNDDELLELTQYAITIEQHYSNRAGHEVPMDIEWAKDGLTNELFIVQARPETVQSQLDSKYLESFKLKGHSEIVTSGKSVGKKIAAGSARVILESSHMNELQPGEVLVTDITDPDWEPVMKTASAIVTNRGGRTCHAAIIARELGIPAIVGCGDATHSIEDGQEITVSCAEGDAGFVYNGILDYETTHRDISTIKKPSTHMMLNIGNPDRAFEAALLPSDGVGLARLEFIINNSIRIHPEALIKYGSLKKDIQNEIDEICAGYDDHRSFYIERLAEGVGTIAAAFYPRKVIVRMSDFKSNEYASLIGGSTFEPEEENPMLGFRGAGRYFSQQFSDCFAMECAAMKKVREVMGLTNVALMLPFVRSIDEAKRALQEMEIHGLKRGDNELKIYLMCEIPANAILAEQFLEHFDGFSIGSNDLTQLTLGVDRDSGIVTGFDERNEAVLTLMEMAISACKKNNKYVGICGQAPSDYPEITKWLVKQGIDSISLNPDSLIPMTDVVLEIESLAQET
jgi:pyruvate,water dikinase